MRESATDNLTKTVAAIRSSLDDGPTTQGKEIRIIGLVAGIAALVIWWLFVQAQQHRDVVYLDAADISALEVQHHWLGTATQQALSAYLRVSGRIDVVSQADETLMSGNVLPGISQLGSSSDWSLSTQLAQTPAPGILQLTARLQNRHSGEVYVSTLTGSITGLSDLTLRSAQQVYDWLGHDSLGTGNIDAASAEMPATTEGRQLYAQGLDALRQADGRAALDYLQDALSHDSGHPLIHVALADAWALQGYQRKATDHAKRAFHARDGLSRDMQLQVEGRLSVSQRDWPRAESVYRALWEYHPQHLEYGLKLVDALVQQHEWSAGLELLRTLETLDLSTAEQARIDLVHAIILWRQGDWLAGIPIIQKAVSGARSTGSQALLATALRWQFELTDVQPQLSWLDEAQEIFEATENLRGLTDVLHSRGTQARAQGALDQAESHFAQAVQHAETMGDEVRRVRALSGLAIVADLRGEIGRALALKRSIYDSLIKRESHAHAAIALENIGHSLYKAGELAEAQSVFKLAGERFVQVDDQIGIAWRPYHDARILLGYGELSAAHEAIRWALENAQSRPEGMLEAHSSYVLAQILFYRGDWVEARDLFAQLETQYKNAGLPGDAGEAQVYLARVKRALGEPMDPRASFELGEQMLEQGLPHVGQAALIEFIDQVAAIVEKLAQELAEEGEAGEDVDLLAVESNSTDPIASQHQPKQELEHQSESHSQLQQQAGISKELDAGLATLLDTACTKLASQDTEMASVSFRIKLRRLTCRRLLSDETLSMQTQYLQSIAREASQLGLFEPIVEAEFQQVRELTLREDTALPERTKQLRQKLDAKGWHFAP